MPDNLEHDPLRIEVPPIETMEEFRGYVIEPARDVVKNLSWGHYNGLEPDQTADYFDSSYVYVFWDPKTPLPVELVLSSTAEKFESIVKSMHPDKRRRVGSDMLLAFSSESEPISPERGVFTRQHLVVESVGLIALFSATEVFDPKASLKFFINANKLFNDIYKERDRFLGNIL